MIFGEKLRKLRKEKGLSQEQLASQITVSRQALSKWELGTAIPDSYNVLQISKLFGVSTDYLLNDEYESDNDIPSVQNMDKKLSVKQNNTIQVAIGSIISCLSAAGILIIGILSSVFPAQSSYLEFGGKATEKVVVKIGLPAFLEVHNIGWLFVLCIVLVLTGIIIATYPKFRK